ncbi:adenylylsulfate kinase [Marinobacter sp. LV10R510-11A]|uniref:adenylyl-sulfate kinase n=1 Tax=Marinobacter sp. LV10R510-11A TaxID=1415568 RepID=UPI000BB986DC|nr:adenylyl-sulfate kinase [Marinobacter sp. LV10R510-11A]SOB74571.1 adenylylsulfate kinase [Marinobacter sp. LV10R510-11A]
MADDIVWHDHKVVRSQRAENKNQKPCLLWFTGLSGSGKSTVANALDVALHNRGYHTFLLDGDNVRHGLCKDLAFSDHDREENIRRVGEVCKLFADAGLIVMSAFISPFTSDRRLVRKLFPAGEFIEVFMNTPIETCESRDPKGLYQKARSGQIKDFTGIDSPYELPPHPELCLDTSRMSVIDCVEGLIAYLLEREMIARKD